MKTNQPVTKTILTAVATIALALTAWLPGTAQAQAAMKPMKGAEHMRMLAHMDTVADAEALKPGDEVAMVCAKCKTVAIQIVKMDDKGHTKLFIPGEKHLCPGCGGTITVAGGGKDKHDVITHTCSMCGSDSAFCCATKTGKTASEGMDEDKK